MNLFRYFVVHKLRQLCDQLVLCYSNKFIKQVELVKEFQFELCLQFQESDTYKHTLYS